MKLSEKDRESLLRELYASHFDAPVAGQDAPDGLPFVFASAPGRVELAGNHTDHQGGRTISAGVDSRSYAFAALNGTDEIHVFMDGFGEASLRIDSLEPRANESETSLALIRGMAASYRRRGKTLRGFNMVTCSDIAVGRGLSSSAAFEMVVGATIHALCEPESPSPALDLTELALDGVWAEQDYFGKPCGAQDQLASAYGGIAELDFFTEKPRVVPINFDTSVFPYALHLVDSRCDHARFTNEFATIPTDMFTVAHHFGCSRLEDLPYETFLSQLPQIRSQLEDRATLRALHYFEETRRVKAQAQALRNNDFETFIENVRRSGASSAQFLQNVSPHLCDEETEQPAMTILALCAHLLDSESSDVGTLKSAYRILGGGFGGSILAFVPRQQANAFSSSMDNLLGYPACTSFSIGTPGVYTERTS